MSIPKLLLISGVPPGLGYVGEIILRDLCRYYPHKHIYCFAVPDNGFQTTPDPDLNWLPILNRPRKYETAFRPVPGIIGTITSLAVTQTLFKLHVNKLISEAVEFGRNYAIDKVWMVLDSATTIAMGAEIARRLNVPLLSLVWDPPDYLLRSLYMDRFSRIHFVKLFGDTISKSERVAVISEAMKESYENKFKTPAIVLQHGFLHEDQCKESNRNQNSNEFVIGFAGGLYADSAWSGMMKALETINWQLGERKIILRMMGMNFRFKSRGRTNIEYLGWRPLAETVKILSECDVNYLPYPFEEWLHDSVQYSFPTKLSTYLTAGRPVFIHAPDYATLSSFFKQFPVGVCCNTVEPDEIITYIRKLAEDSDFYIKAEKAVVDAVLKKFTIERFLSNFAKFVGIDKTDIMNHDKHI